MAGIAFNLILIRVGQNRSDVVECHLGTRRATRDGQLLTLFNAPCHQFPAIVEEGIQKAKL